MKIELEASLERWVGAELLDSGQADGIRRFESEQAPRRRARWPVVVAMAFGGAMLAAGVLLFVSAHWDRLSPFERMTLLVATVGGFHAAGAFAASRFRPLAITLHAVGTVALGGAIAMAGQIFNLQEHWPTGMLLWAIGAAAGWLLLGNWPQLALMAILTPWWLAGEWAVAAPNADTAFGVVACGVLLTAISYLSVRPPGKDHDPARIALTWIGGLSLLPAAVAAAAERRVHVYGAAPATTGQLALGWGCAILLPLGLAWLLRGRGVWVNALAALWVAALHFLAGAEAPTLVYLWCGIGAAGMVAWGVYELRPERINLGMAGFALTVLFFFFSSVMDKLGRSASLIALGVVCIGGGCYWEKARRRMVAHVQSGGVQ